MLAALYWQRYVGSVILAALCRQRYVGSVM